MVQLRDRTTRGLKIIPEIGAGFPLSHWEVTVKLLRTEHEECTHCQKHREKVAFGKDRGTARL